MNILVCIKQVPARESTLRLREDALGVREDDLSFEINEPDTFALEEAVRLKEAHGGEVVAISLGPQRVQTALREALAKGADRAIHIDTEPAGALDQRTIARALAAAIGTEKFDLVLAGLQSDDLGVGQTGVILAEMLGIPHATIIMEIKPEGTGLRVKRELEGGWFEWVAVPLPALLTIQSGLNKPRYASLLGIKKAKTKPLRQCTLAELDHLPGGPAPAPAIRVRKVYAPVRKKATEFLSGSPKEIATALVGKLRQELSAGS